MALAIFLAAIPAQAQEDTRDGANLLDRGGEATPGPVMRLNMAQQLYRLGLEQTDPILMIAAARLAAGVSVEEAEDTRGADDEAAAEGEDLPEAPDLQDMLAAGRDLAADDPILTALLEDVEVMDTRGRLRGATMVHGSLQPGEEKSWFGDETVFEGRADAEISVWGHAGSNLDLVVVDELDNTICEATGPTDPEYCRWRPRWTGPFRIEIRNSGSDRTAFSLTTN
jgi:hypothetical protein